MSDLSLCLPFEPPARGGGGFGFLRLWERWLTQHGIPWTRAITDRHPVLFVNSWHTRPVNIRIARCLRPGLRVIHRVDGWPPLYGRTDGIERRLVRLNREATLTIYQSQWARETLQALGFGDGPVIYNPVDVTMFYPRAPSETSQYHVAVVSWSDNPSKGLRAYRDIIHANQEITFINYGRLLIGNAPNLRNMGEVPWTQLPALLRECEVLLTMADHEACPNHVLEALASGLPVLYRDSGATRELVADAGAPVTVDTFAAAFASWRLSDEQARRRALEFACDRIFPQYLKAISDVL